MRTRLGVLSFLAVLLVAVAGCSKVTMENYEKIQTGMAQSEVEAILGSGTVEEGGGAAVGDLSLSGKVVRWGSDSKHIKVTFANGKVVGKTQKGL
jgi:hypothetical protein